MKFDSLSTSATPLPVMEGIELVPVASEEDAVAFNDRPLVAAIEARDADEVIRLLKVEASR